MTQPTGTRPQLTGPDTVTSYRTEPRPDGSTVLVLLTPDAPGVLTEHRFFLDRYVAHFLLGTFTRDLAGMPDPGPRPEAAALIAAIDTGNRDAITEAVNDVNACVLNLWTNGGDQA